MVKTSRLLRGGRLASVRKDVVKFTSSIKSDRRLLKSVIKINQAHVAMLMEQKIIEWPHGSKLLQALSQLEPKIKLKPSLEDVHVALEEEVNKKVGQEIGGNLHIAKSRNDQVSTAIKMELRQNLLDLMNSVTKLQETIRKLAEKHIRTVVPGHTHLHPAQPVTFAHYLLSYLDMLERDLHRLEETYQRVNLCPMGAGALATSSFPIDRDRVAELLGFSEVLENSIDAVGSRDFVLETMADLTIISIDVSRLVEDLILWSSPNFGIVELPDRFSFTSSIMPQKKNPDVLEVIRARTSHVIGNFLATAATLKALPSSYNMDFQEITPGLWESLENVRNSLTILSKLVAELKVFKNVFHKPFLSFSTSTELANMLVRKHKVPFRTAHRIVGSLTKILTEQKSTFSDLTPELLHMVAQDSSGLSLNIHLRDIKEATDPFKFVESHKARGGPSPTEVNRMLRIRKQWTAVSESKLSKKKLELNEANNKLQSLVQSYSSSDTKSVAKPKN
ncbi:MAG: argininosuccinate lyase [Candidatus Bathyarchaeota archaeon]|nr:MAG: argininosuccinate lyase [Candidatus Bathyarchaeota archaeon]